MLSLLTQQLSLTHHKTIQRYKSKFSIKSLLNSFLILLFLFPNLSSRPVSDRGTVSNCMQAQTVWLFPKGCDWLDGCSNQPNFMFLWKSGCMYSVARMAELPHGASLLLAAYLKYCIASLWLPTVIDCALWVCECAVLCVFSTRPVYCPSWRTVFLRAELWKRLPLAQIVKKPEC